MLVRTFDRLMVPVSRGLAAAVRVLLRPFVARGTPAPIPEQRPVDGVTIGVTRQVLPGSGAPPLLSLDNSINNLDVVDHDGARYLSVRTSRFHWASKLTRLVVLRSTDGGATWSTEADLRPGRDVREPRFLTVRGELFLYYFEAGTNPFRFEPGRIMAMHREGDGSWTPPVAVSPDNYVVWRTKSVDGTPYMVRFRGGDDFFSRDEAHIDVELMTTDDGFDWRPVNPDRPVVHTGGCGETDFAFDSDGDLWAIMRNEAGERGVFGSVLAHAPADDISNWTTVDDPRKFDSPYVFSHGGEIWLLGRRSIGWDGRFDLGMLRGRRDRQLPLYELAYWVTPKRLALWKVDRERKCVNFVADLPSCGDTAFPGIVWDDPDRLVVYNYSSPLDRPDEPWVSGQIGPTNIYATTITFG